MDKDFSISKPQLEGVHEGGHKTQSQGGGG